MKRYKIVALVLILGFCALMGVAYAIDYPEKPGEIKKTPGSSPDIPVRTYVLVRNGSQSLSAGVMSVGSAVIWDYNSDDGVTVALTATSGDGAFAGIVVTTIQTGDNKSVTTISDDIGHRNWGYIQVYGPMDAALVVAGGTNNHAAGDPFITSRDGGKICGTGEGLKAANRGGFFMDAASATATNAEVFVVAE